MKRHIETFQKQIASQIMLNFKYNSKKKQKNQMQP